ncbi:MAG: amidase family protein [Defluviitaleaceae bacterium]|nr:amidase family protein [Defluviitaleaceae bacterium]
MSNFILEETTIEKIQAAVAAKEITYRELVMMYLERIAEYDGSLNSVSEINPDALSAAQMMDDERTKGMLRGTLHGIPVMIKDNINTMDKMQTAAGSLALADYYPMYDAMLIQNLRNSGAIILGKANMTEMSNWMADDMPSGYSSLRGQVKNPYNPDADPSGSSSGSAVSVAANLCTVSVGTETCGSIIGPAAANGIVGIKPSSGLLSQQGIVPISGTLDTAGTMARTVKDAAALLGGMRGQFDSMYGHGAVNVWGGGISNAAKDYTTGLENASIRGLRIGIYHENEADPAISEAIKKLEAAGAVITKDIQGVTPEKPWDYIGDKIAKYEFAPAISQYLNSFAYTARPQHCRSLKDIVAFNEANAEKCLKYGQSILLECLETKGKAAESEYIKALRRRENAIKDLHKIFSQNNLDVLVGASEYLTIAPLTGFPAGTIPIGKKLNGIPLGMYFFARHMDETTLIRAMYAAEQAIGQREKP